MSITIAAGYTWASGNTVTPTRLNTAITGIVISQATSRILGRITAGTGATEELTAAQARTILGLATTDDVVFADITGSTLNCSGQIRTQSYLMSGIDNATGYSNGRMYVYGSDGYERAYFDGVDGANFLQAYSDAAVLKTYRSGVQVGSIAVTTTATAFNTSSDRRLKTNIRDLAPGESGAILDALRVRRYDWRSGERDAIGLIAQEACRAYAPMVTPGDDGRRIRRAWGVDYSKAVPLLIEEVQHLRRRLAAAKIPA